jgi:AraC family transcriptional activator of mar-sox-rob regulon
VPAVLQVLVFACASTPCSRSRKSNDVPGLRVSSHGHSRVRCLQGGLRGIAFCQKSTQGDPTAMTSIDPPDDFRIRQLLRAIQSDPSASISDLAGRLNLSKSRLGHLFKAQTGLSLNVFLANERLERAADLLRCTEMRVKEITYSVGYGQEPSFTRAFKKRFDTSPAIYRRQQRLFSKESRFG